MMHRKILFCLSACLSSTISFSTALAAGQQSLDGTMAEPRIASLAPSDTELVCELGLDKQLIGICRECDYPAAVENITKVGSFTSVDMDKLILTHPDLVLMAEGQEMLQSDIAKLGIRTVLFTNPNVQSISQNLRRLGELTDKSGPASELADLFDRHIQALTVITHSSAYRPKVLFCLWPQQPPIAVGSGCYLNDAITKCGGINIAGYQPHPYARMTVKELVLEQPDVIIFPQEASGQRFLKYPPWNLLKAVKTKRVYTLPAKDKDRLSRPSLRIEQGLLWLSACINPQLSEKLKALSAAWQADWLSCINNATSTDK